MVPTEKRMLPFEVCVAYDVSVQEGDTVLVGRYQSANGLFTSTWTEAIQWRLASTTSHVLKAPRGIFELRIVSLRPVVRENSK